MLLSVIGADVLLENKNYETNQLRVINRKKLDNDLKNYFDKKTKTELMSQFIKMNIPVGAINNLEEVFDDQKAQELILHENIEGVETKRVKTAIFKISD